MRFVDRVDAGKQLAVPLSTYRAEHPLVLALPRGGVPVALEVARALDAPLDIWVVRKVGAPYQPELGIGAVAEGGAVYLDLDLIPHLGMSLEEVEALAAREAQEVEERVVRFRHGRAPPSLAGRTVILVDDGVATGGTMRAAIRALRERGPRRVVLAVPVGSRQSLELLRAEVDELVCLEATANLWAIGGWYQDFHQVSDAEVIEILSEAEAEASGRKAAAEEQTAQT